MSFPKYCADGMIIGGDWDAITRNVLNRGGAATAVVGFNTYLSGRENYWFCDGVADDVQINLAEAYVTALGGGSVELERGAFVLADPIIPTGNSVWYRGQGRDTFIDGDGLATGEHAFHITGRDDIIISDLSVQTEDGGGKTCHCVFFEDGSDRFLVENVWVVASDSDGVHVEGTDIDYGRVHGCRITGCDGDGISASMDAANYLDYLTVSGNDVFGNGGDGVEFALRVRDSLVKVNQINGNTGFGVNISDATSTGNVVENNKLVGNVAGGISDGGVGTHLPWLWWSVPNPDASVGQHRGSQMLDGVDTTVGLEFYVPRAFQQLVTVEAVVLQIDDAASGDMVWTVAADYGVICTGSYVDHQDTAGDTSTITQFQLICLDVSAAFDALAAGDLVGFEFTRDGDNGSDTLDEPCCLLGVRLRYV